MSATIVFDGVWKKFNRGEHLDSLRDLLPSMAKRVFGRGTREELRNKEFWAVSDISFEVREGEALGIIGHNGAGKSTVLKLLTRILKPTKGSCSVRGRVGALIEVAAGFHPDLTGRENIFLQGAILGMKRTEISRAFDQIVDFAGIGEFIDTPVKRFSSGMNARLGFAIAANLDPEVLIIDEVLSVGDAQFQSRCMSRMRELRARGVPLIFVSHNLPAVQELCTNAILLRRGQVIASGSVGETLQAYRRAVTPDTTVRPDSDIWMSGLHVFDGKGSPADLFRSGNRMTVRVEYRTARPVPNPAVAVDIHSAAGVYCYGISTRIDGHELGVLSGAGHVDLEIDPLQLAAGAYTLSIGIHRPGGIGSSGGIGLYDLHEFAYPFSVTSERGDLGLVPLDHHWRHQPGIESAEMTASNEHGRNGLHTAPAAGQRPPHIREVAIR